MTSVPFHLAASAALTSLTLKEAIRRKALLVFAVFALLLMFAGWFLTNSNERAELQVGIHIAFILQTISWIMMPVVFFELLVSSGRHPHSFIAHGCDETRATD